MKHEFNRWRVESAIFKDMKRIADEEEKEKIIDAIADCARERWFLLNLKAKYAGIADYCVFLCRNPNSLLSQMVNTWPLDFRKA